MTESYRRILARMDELQRILSLTSDPVAIRHCEGRLEELQEELDKQEYSRPAEDCTTQDKA